MVLLEVGLFMCVFMGQSFKDTALGTFGNCQRPVFPLGISEPAQK